MVAAAAVVGLVRGRGTYPLTGGKSCVRRIYIVKAEAEATGAGEDVEPNCPALG